MPYTAQKMKFSIKDFFSKRDQIRIFLRIWLHLLKKFLMENFVFLCSVITNDLQSKSHFSWIFCASKLFELRTTISCAINYINYRFQNVKEIKQERHKFTRYWKFKRLCWCNVFIYFFDYTFLNQIVRSDHISVSWENLSPKHFIIIRKWSEKTPYRL